MSQPTRASHPIYDLLPTEIPGFDSLAELALDMHWSWAHATDEVWRRLDPELWEITQNPWVVLQTVSPDRIENAFADPGFRKCVEDLVAAGRESIAAPAWFQRTHAAATLSCVAYFSMEFMLSEALPIYSGGLGNVAGDQLKAASDLGVPVVGVGLLYQRGYFRQALTQNGEQQALYPFNDPGQLPITPLRDANGEWLRLEVVLPGYSVWVRAWQVQVGRVKLYLLDSNDAANYPIHRGITSELYGGGPELRLKQELLLGIGGWRLLRTLGLTPEVCHLNEGHAAFAIVERARNFMDETGQPFDVALAVTRAGNLFTTHTAVAAGFDRFSPALIEQYLSWYAENRLHISIHDLMALGRQNPDDANEPFNMAYLAIHGSWSVNGVSRLHGDVSRRLFQPLFPRWPEIEVPVGYVTNGVHMPTWDSKPADDLWTQSCGKHRWLAASTTVEQDMHAVPDSCIWEFRMASTRSLVDFARKRLSRDLAASGAPAEEVEAAKHLFNPDALTLGFARRFATYKRPNLLLHDRARLLGILTNPDRPVQLIIAGKAHPADLPGQALIQEWTRFIRTPEVRPHAIFLADYDMMLTEQLVGGADVWINTPRRPWEACGTSGMKVLVNGGLNLSELDGWWAEAYTPEIGWALGDGHEHGDDPAWDAAEAEALYDLLEHSVIPEFYSRTADGTPTAWVARMRMSMARLTPQYSADRAVREYTENLYLPSGAAYCERAANRGAKGVEIVEWQRKTEKAWPTLHFGRVKVDTRDGQHFFEVEVFLGDLDPSSVCVELYADGAPPEHHKMERAGTGTYRAQVPAPRWVSDYTPRVIPCHPGVPVPLQTNRILWQH
jgi:glycogen phosphorylase